ncbi:CYTH and CHAD domain-containing protein [Vallicoccus soli]|uniref:CHAD domain-containing protein n=1 Tax=Vallicoccus soli TaxID=2339232 RepID=A0A3A3YX88_9ACTN|nr:CYTH and CHAD domain-containing protein [Vallicoccus soli]RJK96289.1 CHAD domain-containing protein [Vallicoccus soli]
MPRRTTSPSSTGTGPAGSPTGRTAAVPTSSYEVERTYALAPDAPLPDLAGAGEVAAVGAVSTHRLDATYWDTADLRLAARGVRLRRRTGGTDAGWHVKLPDGSGTTEVHLPPGRSGSVPRPLASLVAALVRDAELVPVARLRTRRTEHALVDAGGTVLALVADDDVQGEAYPRGDDGGDGAGSAAVLEHWREVEVELAPDADGRGTAVLDAVQERLLAAGAEAAEHPSKVGRVLGTTGASPWPGRAPRPRPKAAAGDVLTAHLREQVDALLAQDVRVRRDQPDAVHKMRVATRRLRSALRTFRPLLDEERTRPLGDELRWLAGELGGMRDREVLLARLLGDVAELPAEQVLGPVAARVESSLTSDFAAARRAALVELDGPRYRELVGALVELAAAPPLTPAAGERADRVLPPLVRKVHRRLLAEVEAARAGTTDEAYHEARKTAKRLRYAAEALTPAFGADARELAGRAEQVQEVLGEHQDSVVARDELRRLAGTAHRAGEDGFTYGLLWAREAARAAAAEAAVVGVAARLRGGKAKALYR